MGKRTRNLEYYGYIDQNEYMGYPNVDLSDIREVNKEQDKDIDAISGATAEKADKATVAVISGQLDTFIDTQGEINKRLVQQIRINRTRIEALEERGSGTTEEIEKIVDEKLGDINQDITDLNTAVEEINEAVTENSNAIKEVSAICCEKFSQIDKKFEEKLDKTEAEGIYAKKVDTYTKSEVDALIGDGQEGAATKAWVDENYLSKEDANIKYASKAYVESVSDRVNTLSDGMNDKYNKLNGDFTSYSATTDARLATLTQNVDTVSAKVDREIASLKTKDEELQGSITANNTAIRQITEISLPNKVNQSEFDSLKTKVDNMSSSVEDKVSKTDYDNDQLILGNKFDNFDNKKADKTALETTNANVADLSSKLDGEKTERALADSALGSRIDDVNAKISDIEGKDIEQDNEIVTLKNDLAQEVSDRQNADAALVGTSNDSSNDNTIWGAKKYADAARANAISESKEHTNTQVSELRNYVDKQDEDIKASVTAKADKTYVDDAIKGYDTDIDNKIAKEKERAETAEAAIQASVDSLRGNTDTKLEEVTSGLAKTDGIVRSLTDWNGEEQYDDSGNGIVDVMHREVDGIKNQLDQITGNTSGGTVIGEGLVINNPNELAVGMYNISTRDEDANGNGTIFSIGIGTSSTRKNALEVRKNGDVYMNVEGDTVKINDLLSMLTNETY